MGKDSTLSAEDRLLILIAEAGDEGETLREAREIVSGDVDWPVLLRKAARHRLGPLLFSRLKKVNHDHRVPDGVMKSLRTIYYASALKNMRFEHELATILRCFHERGIDCIVLKGLFVQKSLYDDMAHRPMVDIDLLIRYRDLGRVDRALRDLGYTYPSGSLPAQFFHRIHFHVVYHVMRRDLAVPVEVHWNIQDRFNVLRIDIDQVWERAVPWEVGDTRASAMCWEDLLAYLCYHADKHACFSRYVTDYSVVTPDMIIGSDKALGLLWYGEILRLVLLQESALDWAMFADRCLRWGIEREVYSTLSVVNRLFGVSVAEEPLAAFGPPRVSKHHASLYPVLLVGREAGGHARRSVVARLRSRLRRAYAVLRFRPARFLDVSTYIFPGVDLVSRRYSVSGPLAYAYYLAHVCRASFRTLIHFSLLVYCVAVRRASRR